MKKHIILPITLAAMMMLGGCNNSTTTTTPTTPSTEPTSTEPGPSSVVAESVSITNKTDLQAEWHVGEATRKVIITASPEIENINECLNNGSLTITSSNAEIVSVTRLMLTPKAAGKATITVNYGGKSDSVEITVSVKLTAIDKYGTVHAGTAEDPFDNADAVKAAPLAKEASDTTKYYIKGIVHSFYHTPGERTDGVVSWYIKDAEGNKGFECYKILNEDGSFLTDDDIWIGAEVIAKGALTVYSGQAETDTGIFVENTGKGAPKPEARKTITATVAEAVAAGKALEDGASTWDYYKVTGYVAIAEGTNVWIADEKGSTAGKTDLLQLYLQYFTGKVLDPENNETTVEKGLTLNAKVEATMIIKNYHDQVENTLIEGDIKILEAGEVDTSTPVEATVTQACEAGYALESGATTALTYNITGVIIDLGTWSDEYNNVNVKIADSAEETDTTKILTVYRFKDKATYDLLAVGDKVVVSSKLTRYVKDTTDIVETVSGAAVVTKIGPNNSEAPTTVTSTVANAIRAAQIFGATTADNYEITGYIVAVTTAFSSQYNNITFSISDEENGLETLSCYRVATTAEVAEKLIKNAQVKVTGKLTVYKGTPQVDQGGTVEVLKEAPVAPAKNTVYTKTTNAEDIKVGTVFTLASIDHNVAAGAYASNLIGTVDVTIAENSFPYVANLTVFELEAGTTEGSFKIKDTVTNGYLSFTDGLGNKIAEAAEATDNTTDWTIAFTEAGTATFTNVATTERLIQYNAGSPRFACYKNTQVNPSIMLESEAA